MKTAISLPDSLFQSAEIAARDLGLSRSALIQLALERFLKDAHDDKIVNKLNEIYSKVDSHVPSDIKAYQDKSLVSEDW